MIGNRGAVETIGKPKTITMTADAAISTLTPTTEIPAMGNEADEKIIRHLQGHDLIAAALQRAAAVASRSTFDVHFESNPCSTKLPTRFHHSARDRSPRFHQRTTIKLPGGSAIHSSSKATLQIVQKTIWPARATMSRRDETWRFAQEALMA
jgi:hypothetical protein